MKKIYVMFLLVILLSVLLFAEISFRVPNGFGKVQLTAQQRQDICYLHKEIYTPEIKKSIAEFEQKKKVWRNNYLDAAWGVLTSEQKARVPEKYRRETAIKKFK